MGKRNSIKSEKATISVSSSAKNSSPSQKGVNAQLKELKNKYNYECSATDPVVVNLDIIPKLLFEGMVSQKATTVENAVENLADIFRLSSEKRIEAYQAGGHAVLVVTMKKWRLNESIQTSSCRCIQNMSCTNAEAKESFAVVGGMEAVLNAMRTFPKSQRVQRSACGALMNLLSGSDEERAILDAMADKFVKEWDGIALIVAAMRNFPKEVKIQLWGNGLFQNLAQNRNYRMKMMKSGAVTAAGGSLEQHSDDENIKQYASKFLRIMFS
ncbi:armadillo repeat containing 6 [Seminavis robusta]|uniref:Armadillo repeat containing 6 n=1 Tax=Seminavis robusta TaxID=568900 RepID=A0A9N8D8B0_9STRA|nr:armadillo repeat containing 6 [Seminavis robusta]|eukprot:Sro13_g010250.1 armadillo repeat containing 6 (270) ;mRNA; f:165357-166166